MAKRIRGFTKDKYEKWLNEGRGQGIGIDYKPWLTIQDVPSRGRCQRLRGNKIPRQHELLSDQESNYFYIVEFADSITDIREQFPLLPIEQTLAIAEKLNIEHPRDPKTGEYVVMTTDFLLTISSDGANKLAARTIKSVDELDNKRQIEKFEIERRYWEIKDIDWRIVSEKEIDITAASNINSVRAFFSLEDKLGFENLTSSQISSLKDAFKEELHGDAVSVRCLAEEFDKRMMLEPGTSIALFKHLVITKRIRIDIRQPLDIDIPMNIRK
jgi:hypothetical protein